MAHSRPFCFGVVSGSRAHARIAWGPPLRGSPFVLRLPIAYALGYLMPPRRGWFWNVAGFLFEPEVAGTRVSLRRWQWQAPKSRVGASSDR